MSNSKWETAGTFWGRLTHLEVDLVVGGRPPHDPAFRTLASRPNELVVVARSGDARDPDALSLATWLLREPGSGTRGATQELFALLGIAPPCLTIGSNVAIRECVLAGLGVSLLGREAVAAAMSAGLLSIVETPATPLARDWHLVANSEGELSRSARRFVDHAIATTAFVASQVMRRKPRARR
jgi:LysR family transcriptional regulator, low CO2-responsive transcriptional regulator